MPVKSKSQLRFMKGVEQGNIKAPGLSKKEAAEFTKNMTKQDYKRLPESKSNRFEKIRKKYES